MLKIYDVAQVLRGALHPLGVGIDAAFIYGALARGSDDERSQVDLLVIGDAVTRTDILRALAPVQHQIGWQLSPSVYGRKELRHKLAAGNRYVASIMQQPKIFVVGSEAELP